MPNLLTTRPPKASEESTQRKEGSQLFFFEFIDLSSQIFYIKSYTHKNELMIKFSDIIKYNKSNRIVHTSANACSLYQNLISLF